MLIASGLVLPILRVLGEKFGGIDHGLYAELVTEYFLLVVFLLVDVLQVALRLSTVHVNYNSAIKSKGKMGVPHFREEEH